MHLSSFITSMKDRILYTKLTLDSAQKKEPNIHTAKNASSEKSLYSKRVKPRQSPQKYTTEEKDSHTQKYTYVRNFRGNNNPLLIKIRSENQKKERRGKKEAAQLDIEFIFETENLGPVLLRLEIKDGFYSGIVYLYSEDAMELVNEDEAEIELIWNDFMKRAGLGTRKIKWKIFTADEKRRFFHEKRRLSLDQRV